MSTAENGRAVHLLKPTSKKRKRRSELEDQKVETESKKRKLLEYDALELEYHKKEEELVHVKQQAFEMQSYIEQQHLALAQQEQEKHEGSHEVTHGQ